MPSYAALFDGAPDRPLQEASDLVAYLQSLGRARELAWPEGDAAARAALPDNKWAQMSFDAPQLNAHPGRTRPRGDAPPLGRPAPAAVGQQLWQDNCTGCHGEQGRGDGPAARWLEPAPTNLTEHVFTRSYLGDVLWNGVHGTAMPAWRDQSPENLAALADVVGGFAPAAQDAEPSADQVELGGRVFAANCAECHGDDGGGNGFAAGEFPITPTDFQGKRATLAEVARVLQSGVDGTSMAPWSSRLDESELLAVAHYVRGFFDGTDASEQGR
jgi:mono/diheme cytochrome c family protein